MTIQDSQGATLAIGSGNAPDDVGEITGWSGFGPGGAAIRDRTNLKTTEFRDFTLGLKDPPEVSFALRLDPDNTGQQICWAQVGKKAASPFTLVLKDEAGADRDPLTFDALVMNFVTAGGTDADVTGTLTLKLKGGIDGFPAAP
jgi:hypothetical protein